ncbi:MAG: T9SS type A sorting domain-containing protein [Candidatus Kapabacteria bacterium]|nr:T9SS type A sorting domain-containing protein [Ignavibacteriota bacterium]MCW5886256.1 T9SS type A sorting domain-containing protein [Candidatus Kapabacteria bacterium]
MKNIKRLIVVILLNTFFLPVILNSEYTYKQIFNFKDLLNTTQPIRMTSLTKYNNNFLVTFRFDNSNFIYLSEGENIFNFILKDTSKYIFIEKDGKLIKTHYLDSMTAQISASITTSDNVLLARAHGIISKIDFDNSILVNDTLTTKDQRFGRIDCVDNIVLATTNNVNIGGQTSLFLSSDNGNSWENLYIENLQSYGLDTNYQSIIYRVTKLRNNKIYALTNIRDTRNLYLNHYHFFSSEDFGSSWQKLFDIHTEKQYIKDFEVSPTGNIITVGSKERLDTEVGVKYYEWIAKSTDNGKTWFDILSDSTITSAQLENIQIRNNLIITHNSFHTYYSYNDFEDINIIRSALNHDLFIKDIYIEDEKTIYVSSINEGLIGKFNFLNTSIKDKINSDLMIFPNPASDFITIQLSNKGLQPFAAVDKVQIFDMLGLEVAQTPSSVNNMKNTQTGASELLRIDLSHLPAGVYFIRINCSNGACSIVEKFVKM